MQVVWTDPALERVKEIAIHIALDDPEAAERWADGLFDTVERLGEDDLVEAELEVQAGGGRRIDIEAGLTVIEVKRDLRTAGVRDEAVKQLAGYVRARTTALAQR